MANTKGWKEYLRPFLEEKLNQSFPDPTQFKKDEEFLYAAKTASVFKKVMAELIMWVDSQVAQAEHFERKGKGEIAKPFAIGN